MAQMIVPMTVLATMLAMIGQMKITYVILVTVMAIQSPLMRAFKLGRRIIAINGNLQTNLAYN